MLCTSVLYIMYKVYYILCTSIYHMYMLCYVMPRVLYQVYNHRARGPQAGGRGDYKPDIARVGMT